MRPVDRRRHRPWWRDRTRFARYGLARVETNTPVDVSRTLFRVGSVTKPLTAAAVWGSWTTGGSASVSRRSRQYLQASICLTV
jgi:hypothetical protein